MNKYPCFISRSNIILSVMLPYEICHLVLTVALSSIYNLISFWSVLIIIQHCDRIWRPDDQLIALSNVMHQMIDSDFFQIFGQTVKIECLRLQLCVFADHRYFFLKSFFLLIIYPQPGLVWNHGLNYIQWAGEWNLSLAIPTPNIIGQGLVQTSSGLSSTWPMSSGRTALEKLRENQPCSRQGTRKVSSLI